MSSIIEHDILILFRVLLSRKEFKSFINDFYDDNPGPALCKSALDHINTEIQICSRDDYSSFSIINCLGSKSELIQANRVTSTYLAYKL